MITIFLIGAGTSLLGLLAGLNIGYRCAKGLTPIPSVTPAWTNLRKFVAGEPEPKAEEKEEPLNPIIYKF